MSESALQDLIGSIHLIHDPDESREVIERFFDALESGEIRSARNDDGHWVAETWVKEGILAAFRIGVLEESGTGSFTFVDKDTIPPRRFTKESGVRIVPGGSTVRRGSYLAKGVVMMPPAFVNVGAYVDEGTMIDSHALVGSCAQIGKRVHLSAAAQIGGVLEPVGSVPVIIEDDVVIGGNAGIYEGTIVRRRAVIGAGVVITGSTPVYDLVHSRIYKRTTDGPLEIPEGAVVIPGSRALRGDFAKQHSLAIATPVIVKYRDEKTDAATSLESALRGGD